MTSARFLQTTVEVQSGRCIFKANGWKCIFPGFRKIYEEEEQEEKSLPPLADGEELKLVKLDPSQHWTEPPPRYTEASLVKALEEKGIGRPSTYAPILQTIMTRNYVTRQGSSLIPTDLGAAVTKLLIPYFPNIMDVEFTAKLEDELDEIEEGELTDEAIKDIETALREVKEGKGEPIEKVAKEFGVRL